MTSAASPTTLQCRGPFAYIMLASFALWAGNLALDRTGMAEPQPWLVDGSVPSVKYQRTPSFCPVAAWWQKYALVEGLEPSATRLKAERSDPLSYTSEDRAYCWRIHRLLRIYARVEAAGTILWAKNRAPRPKNRAPS